MTAESVLEETFSSISPAEFFYRNKQMAGFSNPTQAVYTVVRELVENSLDACDTARQFPDVQVSVSNPVSDEVVITVSDNGTGVPHEQVPDAFGRILYGSKYSSRQRRGTFGLGVTMAVLYGQITTDSAALIHTRPTNNEGREYRVLIDVQKNEPIVDSVQAKPRETPGTTVTIHMRGDSLRSRERIIEYLRLSAVGTPHAQILVNITDDFKDSFGPYDELLPPLPQDNKPHPRSADVELLRRIIKSSPTKSLEELLVNSFQQLGRKRASKILNFLNFSSRTNVSNLSRKEVALLSDGLRKFDGFGRPDSSCLSPIGKESFVKSVQASTNSEIIDYACTDPSDCDGFPFIIEAVLATGEMFPTGKVPSLYRFANRVPLLYDPTEDVFSKVIRQLNWTRYGLDSGMRVAVYLHFCSTRVPYKAAGKQSIASACNISEEALTLLRYLGRSLRKRVRTKRNAGRAERRMRKFESYFETIIESAASLADIDHFPDSAHMVKSLFEVE
ncbi:DNA topoisomerase VI subunit B [Candidatus Thorarchaeota archaeon]|nr:MAG: DNA topoisomerase VI subunit B [Candidatus Thorarchaeota archaeon]